MGFGTLFQFLLVTVEHLRSKTLMTGIEQLILRDAGGDRSRLAGDLERRGSSGTRDASPQGGRVKANLRFSPIAFRDNVTRRKEKN